MRAPILASLVAVVVTVAIVAGAFAYGEAHPMAQAAPTVQGATAVGPSLQGWNRTTVTVNFPAAFVDENYAASCTAVDPGFGARARVERIRSQAPSSLTVSVVNDDFGHTSPSIFVSCVAVHP
jgi:hypothetical protein